MKQDTIEGIIEGIIIYSMVLGVSFLIFCFMFFAGGVGEHILGIALIIFIGLCIFEIIASTQLRKFKNWSRITLTIFFIYSIIASTFIIYGQVQQYNNSVSLSKGYNLDAQSKAISDAQSRLTNPLLMFGAVIILNSCAIYFLSRKDVRQLFNKKIGVKG